MKLTIKNFTNSLNKNFLFENNPHVAVAVSGGPDSMCLVYLINEWNKTKKGKLIALLIDHKLREESSSECKQIKNYLMNLKINSKIFTISNTRLKKKTMAEARHNRYGKLINFCKKNNILHLFLGHHYDDNLETFLIRSVSGSNLEGLNSISYISNLNKINLIRPLLNNTKKQIVAFNKEKEIEYIIDPSNEHLKYTRVIIRNFLNKTKQIKLIKKDFDRIKNLIPPYKMMINEILIKILINIKKQKLSLSYGEFCKLDEELKEKIVEKIYTYFFGKNRNLRYSKVRSFLHEIERKKVNFYNISGLKVIKDTEFLTFSINK